jgi:hypothetical protein
LQYKWLKFGQQYFNENIIENKSDNSTIIELVKSLYIEKVPEKLDRHVIASICENFYDKIIPKLYKLKEENAKGLPFFTKILLYSQFTIMLFGVVIPLTLTSLNINFEIAKYIIFGSTLITSMSVFWLVLNLKKLIDKEMKKYL